MRIFVSEQHVLKVTEIDEFIATKESNGFTIKDVCDFPIAGNNKKLVIIEKWNLNETSA